MTYNKKKKQINFKNLKLKFPELDFSKSDYQGDKKKLTYICKIHGEQENTPNDLNRKARVIGCKKCNNTKQGTSNNAMVQTEEEIRELLYNKHGTKYTYDKIDFTSRSNDVVTTTCTLHGDFSIRFSSLKSGRGCLECHLDNPTGWRYSTWEKKGLESAYFTGFKVYTIKCFGNDETFYKIGKTFRDLNKRFTPGDFPYKHEVLNIFKGTAEEMSILETELKRKHRENKYIPKLPFGGQYECFSSLQK